MKWRKSRPPAEVQEDEGPKGFDDFELRLGDLMRGERATLGKSLLDVQRELKIKATYIAAIENADVSVFETPGFVAGYVRSYARFLGMDPEWAYAKFCEEANFSIHHGLSAGASGYRPAPRPGLRGLEALGDPNAPFVPRGESWVHRIEPGAVGSVLVLALLIAGLGYGGWSVLREVQRVQLAPVEQAPHVVAQIDPLGSVGTGATLRITDLADDDDAAAPTAPTAEALGRLYRPQALEVPVLVPRDGPIAAIDPRAGRPVETDAAAPESAAEGDSPVRVVEAAPPAVEIFAVRPSWVRVQAADGTVLFEKILDAGERYEVPQAEAPARLRAGNSGSLYFSVNGRPLGPAAPGAQVVRNVELSPEALTERFSEADLTRDADLARIVALAEAERQQPAD
ncbi:MAG: helix-turn-helix domain-containing protein [Gemmobacter sp.]